jgi:hypothetical protein
MRPVVAERSVAVAFSSGADVATWRVSMTREHVEQLRRTLASLVELGHVAAFRIGSERPIGRCELLRQLGERCGRAIVAAAESSGPEHDKRAEPAFLMPVYAFDHELAGSPAATAHLLGLDLELIATPSPDEEVGAYLPGRPGRWLIWARPMF